jgi:hypothetical protein
LGKATIGSTPFSRHVREGQLLIFIRPSNLISSTNS